MTKTLNTNESLILYELLAPHMPEKVGEDVLEFVGAIINHILGEEGCMDYAEAVVLLTDEPLEDVAAMDVNEALKIFIEGIVHNKILSLVEFWSQVGYGNS